jgi:hypothetical protein
MAALLGQGERYTKKCHALKKRERAQLKEAAVTKEFYTMSQKSETYLYSLVSSFNHLRSHLGSASIVLRLP